MGRKGQRMSEEQKRHLSELLKGKPAHNKGKPCSEEQKKKMSEAMKGNQNGKGYKFSEEQKKNVSEALKDLRKSEEHRIKMSLGHGGNGEIDKKYFNIGAWRRRNIERTPYCQFCFSEDNLEAHHIIPKSKFPQYHDEDWNCRILCRDCHITCHKQGGY